MYKLLIVDDDFFTRLGIKEAIDWNSHDIYVCQTMDNGKTGYDCAMEEKPDLIICDVRMPIIDGVEFVKMVKEKIDCEIIMLSGYGDYPYVKDCFLNGVFSYLIKPIENETLLNTVLQAKEKLIKSRNEKKYVSTLKNEVTKLKELFFLDVINGKDIDDFSYKTDLYGISLDGPFLIYVHLDQNENRDVFETLVKAKFNEIFPKYNIEFVKNDYLIFVYESLNKDSIAKTLTLLSDEYEKTGATISFAISNNVFDEQSFKDGLLKIKALTESKLFLTISTIEFADSTPKKYKPIIVSAMNFIAQNYNKRINAKIVAEELFVSPSNLMHQFKDELGKTFNDCLTNYRIIMAKKFLRSGKYKIYEVSDMVGYDDVRYFSQIFKQVTGQKPTEYGNKSINLSDD